MKKLLLINSFIILIVQFSCRTQKVEEQVPVINESIEIEVKPEEIMLLSDSIIIEIPEDSQHFFQIKHGAMDEEFIDSVKIMKNNQKKAKNK